MLTPALDHLWRPTQIYVHVAVVQRARAKMIGDMAGQRVTASGARTGSVVGEVRDTRAQRFYRADLDKIGVMARAVNELHWLIVSTPRSQVLEHRQDRPNAGPAGKEQDRPSRRAKVETTERAVEKEPVTGLGLRLEISAHLAARHIADEEGRHIGTRRRSERIGPPDHLIHSCDVDILPRQEHRKPTFQRPDRKPYAVSRQGFDLNDFGHGVPRLYFARERGSQDVDHHVAPRLCLATEEITCGSFHVAQRVLDIRSRVELTRLTKGLAGAANAVGAVERHIDAPAISGVGDALAFVCIDEPGGSIFEIESNLVWHASARSAVIRCDRRRRRGGCSRSSKSPFWP